MWPFERFWASKTQIFVHLGRETPQKRLRNGWRNGRVPAKVTASASPRGDQRSWGVALPSDQASRRSSPARARVPPGPFSPTLYLNSADRGSSAWYIGDPGTHDPTMDAPCEAPAACRDSRIDNARVVPILHRIQAPHTVIPITHQDAPAPSHHPSRRVSEPHHPSRRVPPHHPSRPMMVGGQVYWL